MSAASEAAADLNARLALEKGAGGLMRGVRARVEAHDHHIAVTVLELPITAVNPAPHEPTGFMPSVLGAMISLRLDRLAKRCCAAAGVRRPPVLILRPEAVLDAGLRLMARRPRGDTGDSPGIPANANLDRRAP